MTLFRKLIILGLLINIFACSETISDDMWIDQLPQPWTLTQDQMSTMLPLFQARFPNFQTRLKYIALWRVGTPYEIFKLGEGVEPDPDPILRYDVSDCTGHNLTSLAAAMSTSWDEALARMIDIHYKMDSNGVKQPSYLSRWHFTLDRITANPYTVNITSTLLPEDLLDSVSITLNQMEDGEEFLNLGWNRSIKAYFIPNEQITADLLSKLPALVGVAFVKAKYFNMGIVMGHEGMIIDCKYLLHASQTGGKTVKLDFLEYYFPEDGAFFDGIMIFEFRENA